MEKYLNFYLIIWILPFFLLTYFPPSNDDTVDFFHLFLLFVQGALIAMPLSFQYA